MRNRHLNGARQVLFGSLLAVAGIGNSAAQQEDLDYDVLPAGHTALSPEIDLQLQSSEVVIPSQFDVRDFTVKLPPGFKANVFASGFSNPRFMAVSPEGVVHLSEMSRGRIVALPDRDDDGVADESIVVARGFAEANNMAFYKGDMYVGDTHEIVKLTDADGDGIYEERVTIAELPTPGPCCSRGWHTSRTIVFDEINDKLYVGIGMPCDLCRSEQPFQADRLDPLPANPEWGTILEFNADGTGRRIFATGVRNVVGMDIHPITNELWGDHNGYDIGGPHNPGEWVDVIREGDFMGYPFVQGYQAPIDFTSQVAWQAEEWHVNALRRQRLDKVEDLYMKVGVLPLSPEDSLLILSQKKPAVLVDGHLAPLGLHFYSHDLFPEQFRNAAFVALHNGRRSGSLAAQPGFKVIAVFDNPDGSQVRIADFMTGWAPTPERPDVWGAPVGITSDLNGRLYVSDNWQGVVFRVSHPFVTASWEHQMPDSLVVGGSFEVSALVHVERQAEDRPAATVTADLSAFGGPADVALEELGGGDYRLRADVEVTGGTGLRRIDIHVVQDEQAEYRVDLSQSIAILPAGDHDILGDVVSPQWTAVGRDGAEALALSTTGPVFEGTTAARLQVKPPTPFTSWEFEFAPTVPVSAFGYRSLQFAFRPEAITEGFFTSFLVIIDAQGGQGNIVADLILGRRAAPVDLTRREWQIVDIPLETAGAIAGIKLFGNFTGDFYIDGLRLVSAASPMSSTAVEDEPETALPGTFALQQNYPNPFNSDTVIRFSLPQSSPVRLTIYNLTGQEVASLVDEERAAGVYEVRWDGRDKAGVELSSGTYLYELLSGDLRRTRKLVLLR